MQRGEKEAATGAPGGVRHARIARRHKPHTTSLSVSRKSTTLPPKGTVWEVPDIITLTRRYELNRMMPSCATRGVHCIDVRTTLPVLHGSGGLGL